LHILSALAVNPDVLAFAPKKKSTVLLAFGTNADF
jgi:hypothetical protein